MKKFLAAFVVIMFLMTPYNAHAESTQVRVRRNRRMREERRRADAINENYQPLIDSINSWSLFPCKWSLQTSYIDGSYYIYAESELEDYRIVINAPNNDGSFEGIFFDIPYEKHEDYLELKNLANAAAKSFLTDDEAKQLLNAWYGSNSDEIVHKVRINLPERNNTLEITCEINDKHCQIFFSPDSPIYF